MSKIPPPEGDKTPKKTPKKEAFQRVPPPLNDVPGNLSKRSDEQLVGLNISVPLSFRKSFKNYATDHDMTMTELIEDMFNFYKQHKGQ